MVIELLLKTGGGGSRREAGQAIDKGSGEGIDGVMSEDRLGLDVIYVQAKRWEGTVRRPEIRKFVSTLRGRRAKKGVFLTTGTSRGLSGKCVRGAVLRSRPWNKPSTPERSTTD
ncbi:MAG: restriction endonuclease [Phycisphaerales bacterium JB041]